MPYANHTTRPPRNSTEDDLALRMFCAAAHYFRPGDKLPSPINPNAEKLDNSTPAGVRSMELAFRDL